MTTFKFNANESPERVCLAVLGDVDVHHGEYSHDPPWSVLEVFGASSTAELEAALRGYGVDRIEKTEAGFAAFREVRAV
ncbi:MAG: hypothetical protein ACREXU_22495 [Gammaproteobacteria bacterium]